MPEVKASGLSRRQFVALSGGAAAAVTVLAACGSSDAAGETSEFGDGDAGVLNYLLRLEHLQTAFYADVVKSNLFKGAELETMQKFGEEEAEHVSKLTRAVERAEGEPEARPKTDFPLDAAAAVLDLAAKIENLVASAYLGQAPNVESNSALETVLSIHSVEGRHAAAIDTLLGRSITPDGAFAKPATAKAVLTTLEPFLAA